MPDLQNNPSQRNTSSSNSVTIRLSYPNAIGALAQITQVIGQNGGDLGAIDIIQSTNEEITRDFQVRTRGDAERARILEALQRISGLRVEGVTDRVMALHHHGKIAIQNKLSLNSRETLSMVYTPGVARVCEAIAADKGLAHELTIKANSVAVVSDGSAVLGLGDIGPEAAMPVMEGKAMLFKEFADVDAYPICLATKEVDEIVETVARFSVGFGGINLEDIAAPRCFEIEEKLQARLDIPVFHDDQHGTAIVTLAALMNCLRLTKRKIGDLKIVISGAGAAAVAITKMLVAEGAKDVVVCDRKGAISRERAQDENAAKRWLATNTNPRNLKGSVQESLSGADVFIGVSGPGLLKSKDLDVMNDKPFVFAMANPTPEIMPHEAAHKAYVIATGRSDFPNQINNVLAFPGVFRGALNARARRITEPMKLAAAHAIAECIAESELSPEYIMPSVFNRDVVTKVADAVEKAAYASQAHEPLKR